LAHLCQLQNVGNPTKFRQPQRHHYDGDQITLVFDFTQNEDFVKRAWSEAPDNKKDKALCWSLHCKSEALQAG